jgi:hypothetical protein
VPPATFASGAGMTWSLAIEGYTLQSSCQYRTWVSVWCAGCCVCLQARGVKWGSGGDRGAVEHVVTFNKDSPVCRIGQVRWLVVLGCKLAHSCCCSSFEI